MSQCSRLLQNMTRCTWRLHYLLRLFDSVNVVLSFVESLELMKLGIRGIHLKFTDLTSSPIQVPILIFLGVTVAHMFHFHPKNFGKDFQVDIFFLKRWLAITYPTTFLLLIIILGKFHRDSPPVRNSPKWW